MRTRSASLLLIGVHQILSKPEICIPMPKTFGEGNDGL